MGLSTDAVTEKDRNYEDSSLSHRPFYSGKIWHENVQLIDFLEEKLAENVYSLKTWAEQNLTYL